MNLNEMLNEAKDLGLYKKLLRVLGGYADKFPATGVSKMFKQALENGIKVMPKNKKALAILGDILDSEESVPAKVQRFLNQRFADIDSASRPMYKDGNSKQVAFWQVDGVVSDKVLSLVNLDGKAGDWSNAEGDKVTLIDIGEEDKEDED
jgi:hypothetical protein